MPLLVAGNSDGFRWFVQMLSDDFRCIVQMVSVGVFCHTQQKERWGKEPAFQAWKRNTNLLIPIPK